MLIVEDGTGKPDAESYISVEEADELNEKFGNVGWSARTDKEVKLRRATRYFDMTFGAYVAAQIKLNPPQQLLHYPAYVLGEAKPSSPMALPRLLKEIIAELAFIDGITPLYGTVKRSKKKVKVGTLEVEYDGESDEGPKFTGVMALVSGLMPQGDVASSGVNNRIVRC